MPSTRAPSARCSTHPVRPLRRRRRSRPTRHSIALLNANRGLLKQYPTTDYSPSTTAKILESKGYKEQSGKWVGPDGKPLTITVEIFNVAALGPAWATADELLQQELQQAGFTVKLEPENFDTVIADRTKATGWDAISWFECGSLTEPWASLDRYTNALGNDNPVNWTDAQYDSIVAKMGELPPTSPKIAGLFHQAFQILLQQLPVIPLIQRPEPVVMNADLLDGVADFV